MVLAPRIAFQIHAHELRAELATASCPEERRQIADELRAVLDHLDRMPVPGLALPLTETMTEDPFDAAR